MFKNNLSRLLGERRWTQHDLANKTGIRSNTISDIYHDLVDRINLIHLDQICDALDCDISDIFEHIKTDNNKEKDK